jgi:hypothetical protein
VSEYIARLEWQEPFREKGWLERATFPEDAEREQEVWQTVEEDFYIVRFVDNGEFHVHCEDGTHICCDEYPQTPERLAWVKEAGLRYTGPLKTLEEAKCVAQGDYSEMRSMLFGEVER